MQHLPLINHILTNCTKKIFQSGIIDSGISDNQLIVCTRKMKLVKFHKHSNLFPRSLKNYTVNLLVEGLQEVNFLNFSNFSNIDTAYTDFLNKLIKVINEIDPSKEKRIKNKNQDWIDREATDFIHVWEKLLLKFEKTKLHSHEKIYKRDRNQLQKLIKKEMKFL